MVTEMYQEEQEFTKRFDGSLWRKLTKYIKPYTRHLIVLVIAMLIVGGIDVLFPLLTRYAIDKFIIPGNLDGLGPYILVYISLIVVQSINTWFHIKLAGKIEVSLVYDIRKAGFEHLQKLSFSYYDKIPVGWIMARMTSDAQSLGETISWSLTDLTWALASMIGTVIIMLILNWRLALITFIVIPFLIVISLYFQQKILNGHRRVRKINSKITGSFNEGIMGAKTSKTLVREDLNVEEFKEQTGRLRASAIRVAIFSSIYFPIVMGLGGIGTALVLWFGGESVVAGGLSYGTLTAFVTYSTVCTSFCRESSLYDRYTFRNTGQ